MMEFLLYRPALSLHYKLHYILHVYSASHNLKVYK